ncbi:hypothetical protein ANN_25702 [Periplaneta americana]|uniref:Uncharacterized protein n=1 Tax=Periplaneta americana TaxID=6978 RepID=A0ABQ8S3W6_PERAM|nr:hypothetical protein ANN_25702 [Periplaneta americana]
MIPGSNTESYPAFAHIGLRENPGKNLNQVTCPDRESNPGHLVSRLDVLTVTPQIGSPCNCCFPHQAELSVPPRQSVSCVPPSPPAAIYGGFPPHCLEQ